MINCVNGCDTAKYICAGEFRLSLKPKKPCPYYIDDPGEQKETLMILFLFDF